MKRWIVALGVLALLVLPTTALAQAGAPTTGYHTSLWSHTQAYRGRQGPSCFYGQDVRIAYDAVNTWSYIVAGPHITETLIQEGVARVYDMDGQMIDQRSFSSIEYFYDANGDVAIRHDYGGAVWYQASHNPGSAALEEYNHTWEIGGVYRFDFWNRSGQWGLYWSSGDCRVVYTGR